MYLTIHIHTLHTLHTLHKVHVGSLTAALLSAAMALPIMSTCIHYMYLTCTVLLPIAVLLRITSTQDAFLHVIDGKQ